MIIKRRSPMKVSIVSWFLMASTPSYSDVTVTWSIFDGLKNKNYDHGEQVLKAPSVTRVSYSPNCYEFYIMVYDDNRVTAQFVGKDKVEIRNVPLYDAMKMGITGKCPDQEYGFKVKSTPIEEEKKLFDQG